MTGQRSDRDEVEKALRARASLAGEEYSPTELLQGGAGGSAETYMPGDPLDQGEELVTDEDAGGS